jgi:hypothetical protein
VGVGLFLLIFIAFTTNQEKLREMRHIRERIAKVSALVAQGDEPATQR